MIAESLNIPKTVVLRILERESCVQVLFHIPCHLSKEKNESHFAKTLSRWPMQTKIFLTKLLLEIRPGVLPMTLKQTDSSEWVGETSPQLKKLKFQSSRIKTILILFFNSQGTVHKEFAPDGKTVNAEFFKGVMDCLLKCIQQVCPAAFCSLDFFLLHNNAPAHKAGSFRKFLTPKKCYNPLSPPYTPDLSPPDYFLFPKLKTKLQGLHFADVAEIQEAVFTVLMKCYSRKCSQAQT